jgi:hypothetical protein
MDTVLEQIQGLVDQLIVENRSLKRDLARLQSGAADGASRRSLLGIQRRLQTVLRQPAGRSTRATATTSRRRITDPGVLEKRRQALAKAREVLARKRASGEA